MYMHARTRHANHVRLITDPADSTSTTEFDSNLDMPRGFSLGYYGTDYAFVGMPEAFASPRSAHSSDYGFAYSSD